MNENFCIKCGKCCNNIPVDLSSRMLFFDGIQTLTADFEQMLIPKSKTNNITFCSCKYLDNNICTNPNKPEECRIYPSSPFTTPGSEGMIFPWRPLFFTRCYPWEQPCPLDGPTIWRGRAAI